MYKVLLVALRDKFLDSDRVMPPIGVMTLHSYLMGKGIDTYITNDVDAVPLYPFSHIAISCMTPQSKTAIDLLLRIRRENKNAVVIIGGPHATHYTRECLEAGFDYVVREDGELALEYIIKTRPSSRVLEIDMPVDIMNSNPPPTRNREFIGQYGFDVQGKIATTILTAKGCPNRCGFCEAARTKVKMYTPQNVGIQVDQCKAAGFDSIMFFDDLFTLSEKRTKELADVIKQKNVYYRCFGHAKNMTPNMAGMLRDSGCIEVGYGAEHGSQRLLDIVNKKTTVQQNIDMISICNDKGIKVKAFMMLGLPGESEDSLEEFDAFMDKLMNVKFTNRFGKRITNDFDITVFYPFKGTPIRDNIEEYDINIVNAIDDCGGVFKGVGGFSDAIVETSALSSKQIRDAQQKFRTKYKQKVIL